jgi:hypothetical protein
MVPVMSQQALQREKRKKLLHLHFKQVLVPFASSIQGIADETVRHNYTSLVLDRFLVLFFLQHHGLLDNNTRYLQHHLDMMHTTQADTFFNTFFLPLCHTALSGQTPSSQHYLPFGRVPVLAHPLFQKHLIEHSYQPQIPDEPLYKLFLFLEAYRWELIYRTDGETGVVHHDIFADLLEQRSNQKQTGTYYTTDDITGYVANNTILPVLLHRIQKHYPAIMHPHSTIWQHLVRSPARYIPDTLQNPAYLPAETVQEYQLRQQRFTHLVTLLQQGTIRTINAMVTYNLDILRFFVDVISTHQDLDLLTTLFTELERLTILDPTCGSGAFLCAALATLQTLYTACLQRMQELAQGTGQGPTPSAPTQTQGGHCSPRSQRLCLVNHIIAHNLYGVDLMEEATKVCTLRLYLTLLAEAQCIEDVPPFDQIPIHIKTGNALAGDMYSTAFPEVTQLGGFAVILGNPPYIEHSKVRPQYAIAGYEEKSCGNLYAAMLERSLALLHPDGSSIGLLLPMSICGSQRFAQLRTLLTQSLSPMWLANFDIFPCRLFSNAFQRLSILLGRHKGWRQDPPPQPVQADLYTTRIHRWYPEERPFIIDLLRYTPCRQSTAHTPLQHLSVFPKLASTLHAEILQKITLKSNGHTIATALQDHKTPHFVYYQEATNYWIKAICHIPFYMKNGMTMAPPHGRFLFFRDERTTRIIMALMNSSLFYLWFTTYSDGFHLAHSLVTSFPCSQDLLRENRKHEERTIGTEVASVLLPTNPHSLPDIASMLEADLLTHTYLSTRNKGTKPLPTSSKSEPKDLHAIELTEYQASYSKLIIDEIDRHLSYYYDFTREEFDFIINYDRKYRMGRGK